MIRRIAQLLSVTVLLVALSVPIAEQQESIGDLRARAEAASRGEQRVNRDSGGCF